MFVDLSSGDRSASQLCVYKNGYWRKSYLSHSLIVYYHGELIWLTLYKRDWMLSLKISMQNPSSSGNFHHFYDCICRSLLSLFLILSSSEIGFGLSRMHTPKAISLPRHSFKQKPSLSSSSSSTRNILTTHFMHWFGYLVAQRKQPSAQPKHSFESLKNYPSEQEIFLLKNWKQKYPKVASTPMTINTTIMRPILFLNMDFLSFLRIILWCDFYISSLISASLDVTVVLSSENPLEIEDNLASIN